MTSANGAGFNPRNYLSNIQDRPYLDVAHRVHWLNEQQDRFDVSTELLHYSGDYAVVRATIRILDDTGQAVRTATAHAQAYRASMQKHLAGRFLEKAETAAIGRALGLLGLGTLAAQEFDDSDHLADSPRKDDGRTFGKRAPDEPAAPALEAELALDDAQWQAEVRSQPQAAVTGSGVTEAQLRTIAAHVTRTRATLAQDVARLTRDEASALIRDLSKRPNHA